MVYGITNDKMLDQFIHMLGPIICSEVLKENPQTFEAACILVKWTSWISNLVGGGGTSSKWRYPSDYALVELDSMGAR